MGDGSTGVKAAVGRLQVSGIVTCFNEEANIGPCIESLAWCDEIIVVDSYSTDRTAEIARSYPKVRLYERTYYGGASQKNWAIGLAQNEWIIILDADERCTQPLREEIEGLLRSAPAADAYTIRRRCHFMGRVIRFSGWRNDRVKRLFRRGTAYYDNRRVHARLVVTGPAPMLRHPMEHLLIDDLDSYVQRINRYGYWGAAQCWRDGVRSGLPQILFRPLWRFLRTYLFQAGFLDGTRGLVFCMLHAYATYLKWSLLWSWRLDARRGRGPELPEFDDDSAVWSGLERMERGEPAVAVKEAEKHAGAARVD